MFRRLSSVASRRAFLGVQRCSMSTVLQGKGFVTISEDDMASNPNVAGRVDPVEKLTPEEVVE